jgi:uncharacterized protein YutE (UPF0331/DUF86 family)
LIDPDLIIAKASSVRGHLDRIAAKTEGGLEAFLANIDLQEVVAFNLHLAVENCIDIAAHIISENGWGVPGSASEMFLQLEKHGMLDAELTAKMIKAIGLRNLIVHEYARINLKLLFEIARKDIHDLNTYVTCLFERLDIAQ